MSSKIHVIKCPQCASPEYKLLDRENHYLCISCNTTYMIDTDDIKIEHHHYHTHTKDVEAEYAHKKGIMKGLYIFLISIFIIPVLLLVSFIYFGTPNNDKSIQTGIQSQWYWNIFESSIILNKKKEPILFAIGEYQNRTDHNKTTRIPTTILFYDPITQNTLHTETLESSLQAFSDRGKIITFDDGSHYLIALSSKIYLIDTENYKLTLMNEEYQQKNTALSEGIIKVDKSYYGDGFKITTSTGKEIYYFPHSNQALSQKQVYAYINNPPAIKDATILTKLTFAVDNILPTDNEMQPQITQLIEYQQKISYGMPYRKPVFYQRDIQKRAKHFFTQEEQKKAQIIAWRNVTPDRPYHHEKIACYNTNYAFIQFKENANELSTRFSQLLDLKSGKSIWTINNISEVINNCSITAQNEVVVSNYKKTFVINAQGKIEKDIKWD